MPKVELDNLVISVSPITEKIFAGVFRKEGVFTHKKDITDNFISCVIYKYEGFKEVVQDNKGNKYEISVKKITN